MNAETNLTITINETGFYKLDALFLFNTPSSNGATGIKFDFGGGTAVINATPTLSFSGSVNNGSSFKPAVSTPITYGVISTSPTIDWVKVNGLLQVNTAGTLIPRYAQGSAGGSLNSASLLATSYWSLTKVG